MKAAILEKYNKNGNDLIIKDIPIPAPSDDEVLIKVHTAGVNPLDNMIIKKEVNLIVPYKMPLVMGNEFVGVIEKKGKNVNDFNIGDRVYARMPLDKIGAFTEYLTINKKHIAKVPSYLSDEEAATIPLTALTALQSYKLMNVKSGETIFISGGTGSLGAMAIPIANYLGLKVITNGNGMNEERVMKLGASKFIDYKKEDYVNVLKDVDYVLDTLGAKEIDKEFKILKNGGTVVSLKAMPNKEFAERMNMSFMKKILFGLAGSEFDKKASKNNQKYYFIFVEADGEGLKTISNIFEDKEKSNEKIETSVDEVFSLDQVNAALKKVASGKSKGKTVLKINE